MERLTYWCDDGQGGGEWRVNIYGREESGPHVNRLAAYEDTGLEPEDIKRAFNEAAVLKLAGQALGITPDRLHELAQADREGRCVVLPAGGYTDKDGENALKSAMNTCFYHNNPVTRFIADAVAEKLTHEEAEATLRREQDEKGGSSE